MRESWQLYLTWADMQTCIYSYAFSIQCNGDEERQINKCKPSTLNREGGGDYVNERLVGKMSMLLKPSKMGKIAKTVKCRECCIGQDDSCMWSCQSSPGKLFH